MSLISVIVPIYNVERYVSQAIESLLHQNGCELEIILVDDGSTDKSGEIAQQYADQHDNIVCIHQKNQGLSAARNTGIDYAHGEYIMFLDSDDYFESDSIAQIEKEMNEGCYDVIFFSGKKYMQDSGTISPYGKELDKSFGSGYAAYNYLRACRAYYTCVWLMTIRKDFLRDKKICFREGIIHEDHLYMLQILMHAGKVRCLPVVVYNYRVRPKSIMTGKHNNGKRLEGFCECLCEFEAYADIQEIDSKLLKEHKRYIGTIVAKYFLKMTRIELIDYSPAVKKFVSVLGQDKSCVPLILRIGCMIRYRFSKTE